MSLPQETCAGLGGGGQGGWGPAELASKGARVAVLEAEKSWGWAVVMAAQQECSQCPLCCTLRNGRHGKLTVCTFYHDLNMRNKKIIIILWHGDY